MSNLSYGDLDGIINLKNVTGLGDQKLLKSIESGLMRVICILGTTGVGKSSLGNNLSHIKGIFKASADVKSETDETSGVITKIESKGKMHQTLIIDTPGYGDTEGRDSEHTAKMILSLKSIKYVNAFIVCLNS